MSEGCGTPEKSKDELFAENPERFEDLKNCLLVVKRNEEGKMVILNQCESIDEAILVEGYTHDAMLAFRGAMRVRAAQSGIVKPGQNGFLNGVRNLGRKR